MSIHHGGGKGTPYGLESIVSQSALLFGPSRKDHYNAPVSSECGAGPGTLSSGVRISHDPANRQIIHKEKHIAATDATSMGIVAAQKGGVPGVAKPRISFYTVGEGYFVL